MSALLTVDHLCVSYGPIAAVRDVSFTLKEGEITALVGANGAGKSTTLLALSGLLPADSGRIDFQGRDLLTLASHQIVASGLVQVAEGRAILGTLTVDENLALGAYTRRDRDEVTADREKVLDMFPVLRERINGFAGNLSGGEQQMLAIGRALMAKPRILLLDEPSMGLAPLMVKEIFRVIQRINEGGMTILLVEQNVRQALRIAHHGYVLENGRIVAADSGSRLLNDARVIEAYLGA